MHYSTFLFVIINIVALMGIIFLILHITFKVFRNSKIQEENRNNIAKILEILDKKNNY